MQDMFSLKWSTSNPYFALSLHIGLGMYILIASHDPGSCSLSVSFPSFFSLHIRVYNTQVISPSTRRFSGTILKYNKKIQKQSSSSSGMRRSDLAAMRSPTGNSKLTVMILNGSMIICLQSWKHPMMEPETHHRLGNHRIFRRCTWSVVNQIQSHKTRSTVPGSYTDLHLHYRQHAHVCNKQGRLTASYKKRLSIDWTGLGRYNGKKTIRSSRWLKNRVGCESSHQSNGGYVTSGCTTRRDYQWSFRRANFWFSSC